jgi:hypothetical protein
LGGLFKEGLILKWKPVGLSCVSVFFLLLSTHVFSSGGRLGFESAEHVAAGSNLKLFFSSHDSGQVGKVLTLANGLAFDYGQMLALTGDFYEIPGQPISEGKSLQERKKKFVAAYESFAKDRAAVSEAPKIYAVIEREKNAVLEGMKKGEKPEAIYAKIGDDDNREWNCITGGGCSGSWWLTPGRYLTLSKKDYDHFGNNAWLAYVAGHEVALEAAMVAHATGDVKQLEVAYTMNAFASHFLSDYFAAGHMRTPRTELPDSVTPSVVGSLLVHFMHNEENQYGLHVHNLRGEHWFASGDQYYFDSQNEENRRRMQVVLQESIDEIFSAYQYGVVADTKVLAMLPYADESGNAANQDIAPLFYYDHASHVVFRRTDTANVYDHHWTSDWWGWSTFIMLSRQKGLPTSFQQDLVAAGYGKKAMEYGLITDKVIAEYVRQLK